MLRITCFAALAVFASAFGHNAALLTKSKLTASRVVSTPVAMVDPTDRAVTIGAAAAGGLVGVQLTGELSWGVLLSIVCAYGTTLSNGFGDATKTLGSLSSKTYSKSVELNEQYDILPKAKSAIDTTVTIASNLDANYGISAKVDEQLKLSQAVDSVRAPPHLHADT